MPRNGKKQTLIKVFEYAKNDRESLLDAYSAYEDDDPTVIVIKRDLELCGLLQEEMLKSRSVPVTLEKWNTQTVPDGRFKNDVLWLCFAFAAQELTGFIDALGGEQEAKGDKTLSDAIKDLKQLRTLQQELFGTTKTTLEEVTDRVKAVSIPDLVLAWQKSGLDDGYAEFYATKEGEIVFTPVIRPQIKSEVGNE